MFHAATLIILSFLPHLCSDTDLGVQRSPQRAAAHGQCCSGPPGLSQTLTSARVMSVGPECDETEIGASESEQVPSCQTLTP